MLSNPTEFRMLLKDEVKGDRKQSDPLNSSYRRVSVISKSDEPVDDQSQKDTDYHNILALESNHQASSIEAIEKVIVK